MVFFRTIRLCDADWPDYCRLMKFKLIMLSAAEFYSLFKPMATSLKLFLAIDIRKSMLHYMILNKINFILYFTIYDK